MVNKIQRILVPGLQTLAFAMVMMLFVTHGTNAQLLQDRNKLKTAVVKKERKGFVSSGKNVRRKGKVRVQEAGAPRYSRRAGRQGAIDKVSPKFSSRPVVGRSVVVNPKYSRRKAAGRAETVNPKYSKRVDYTRVVAVNPKYTKARGPVKKIVVNPRYSRDPDYASAPGKTPRTLSDRGMVFSMPRLIYNVDSPLNRGEERWASPENARFRGKGSDYHPSSNYIFAKYQNIKLVRQGLRQFNLAWNRLNGNKSNPKIVDKKSEKAKYDKHEAQIWNNKEREYIKN